MSDKTHLKVQENPPKYVNGALPLTISNTFRSDHEMVLCTLQHAIRNVAKELFAPALAAQKLN